MSCDVRLYRRLKFLFGDALTQVGKESYYMGSMVVPAALEVEHSLQVVQAGERSHNPLQRQLRRAMVKFFLEGLPPEKRLAMDSGKG